MALLLVQSTGPSASRLMREPAQMTAVPICPGYMQGEIGDMEKIFTSAIHFAKLAQAETGSIFLNLHRKLAN